MRQETIINTYDNYNNLSKEKQAEILEEELDSYISTDNNMYFEMRHDDWKEDLAQLKRKYKIDFDVEFEYGSSYIYIKKISFEDAEYYNDAISIEYIYNDLEFYSYYLSDNLLEKFIKNHKSKYEKLVEEINELFNKKYYQVFLCGYDEGLEEFLKYELEYRDDEYLIKSEVL